MQTIDTPAALPATIALSKSNVRDFIRARGVNVPVILAGGPLKEFIRAVSAEWAINLTTIRSALLTNCQRAGQTAAKTALERYIEEKFPVLPDAESNNIPDTLPRYTVENAMIIGAEAAEKAIRPWVLSGAHHTNPNRQAAGAAAAATRTATLPAEKPVEAVAVAQVVPEVTKAPEETPVAILVDKIADDRLNTYPDAYPEAESPPVVTSLEYFLTEHGLRTMDFDDPKIGWICCVAGLTDETLGSAVGMRAAQAQGLVVRGVTELQAVDAYAARNKLVLPEELLKLVSDEANSPL